MYILLYKLIGKVNTHNYTDGHNISGDKIVFFVM